MRLAPIYIENDVKERETAIHIHSRGAPYTPVVRQGPEIKWRRRRKFGNLDCETVIFYQIFRDFAFARGTARHIYSLYCTRLTSNMWPWMVDMNMDMETGDMEMDDCMCAFHLMARYGGRGDGDMFT